MSASPPASAPDSVDKMLTEAVREKLRSLLTGELTPKVLQQISDTAHIARDLLAAGKLPPMKRRRAGQIFSEGQFAGALGYDVEVDDESDGSISMASAPMAPSPKAETFGATLIREAVSAYADIMNRPREVPMHEKILAISYARSHGLEDLAKRLEHGLEEGIFLETPDGHLEPMHAAVHPPTVPKDVFETTLAGYVPPIPETP